MCTARRILAEFRKDWPEGISNDNHFIIDNHYEIYQNLEKGIGRIRYLYNKRNI